MVDPVNYGALQTQLDLSPLQRGFVMRRDNQAQEAQSENQRAIRQLAEAKFTAEQEQDAGFQEALKGFSQAPSSSGLLDLSARYPKHAEALQEGFKTYKTGQQQDLIGTVVGAMGLVSAGNTAGAVAKITERRDALKRAGIDTTQTDAAIDLFKSDDPVKQKQGIALLSTVLWGAVGSDDAAKIMDSFGLGAKSADREADNQRAAAQAAETARHNRVLEGQGSERVALSRAAGARAGSKGSGGGKGKKGAYTDAQLDALIN